LFFCEELVDESDYLKVFVGLLRKLFTLDAKSALANVFMSLIIAFEHIKIVWVEK